MAGDSLPAVIAAAGRLSRRTFLHETTGGHGFAGQSSCRYAAVRDR